MILKRFKDKSIQKYVNKLLNQRTVSIKKGEIKTVGVLLNAYEFADVEIFYEFLRGLDIQQARTKIVSYVSDPKASKELWGAYFSPNHIGWKGKINHPDLQIFVDTEYDLLLCFYREPHLELDLIAARSNANMKVGISKEKSDFFDLIIEVQPHEFKTFGSELTKYLNVLNKL